MLYVSPAQCGVNNSDVSTPGCRWITRTYSPVPLSCAVRDIPRINAGNAINFDIEARDQFNHSIASRGAANSVEAHFDVMLVLGNQTFDAQVRYGNGRYSVETPFAVTVAGIYYVRVQVRFRIFNKFERRAALQIHGSPYQIHVHSDGMDFSKSIIGGQGTEIVRQGFREGVHVVAHQYSTPVGEPYIFGGNRIHITVRDRYKNVCPADGSHWFGLHIFSHTNVYVDKSGPMRWDNLTARVKPCPDPEDPLDAHCDAHDTTMQGVYRIDYWVPYAQYDGMLTVCQSEVNLHTFGSNGCLRASFSFNFSVYVLPYQFWKFSGPQKFDAASSTMFSVRSRHDCSLYLPNSTQIREWNGIPVAEDSRFMGAIPTCEKAVAGLPYTFYIQLRDEFGFSVREQLARNASSIFHAEPYRPQLLLNKSKIIHPSYAYYGYGIYAITLVLSHAGVQAVEVTADALLLQHSPYNIHVTAAKLSARKSYADGTATVLAQQGSRVSLQSGNVLYIHSRDRFGNVRAIGTDTFALDPLTQTVFTANIEYVGHLHLYTKNNTACTQCGDSGCTSSCDCDCSDCSDWNCDPGAYRVRFWWDKRYTQNYEVCPGNGATGATSTFGVCLHRCQLCDTTGRVCRQHPDCADDDRVITTASVYSRPNEGLPFSDPSSSGALCMNNFNDLYACHLYTGTAGDVSSFTIEAKNAANFANYRGQDLYVASFSSSVAFIPPAASSHLRTQFYELNYAPTKAGNYMMKVHMCYNGNLWNDPLGRCSPQLDVTAGCLQVAKNGSQYQHQTGPWLCNPIPVISCTVVVQPGVASASHSTFSFPPSFQVGSTNGVLMHTRDQFNNVVPMDTNHVLHVFTHLESALAPIEFPVQTDPNMTGSYSSAVRLQLAGRYNISVQLWIQDPITKVAVHEHVVNSPASVFLHPGDFHVRYVEITNFVLCRPSAQLASERRLAPRLNGLRQPAQDSVTRVQASQRRNMELHAMDKYGNLVLRDGLTIVVTTTGLTTYHVQDLGQGAYLCPYVADRAGTYTVYVKVRCETWLEALPGMTLDCSSIDWITDIFGSPYQLIVDPGPAARATVVAGPGLAGGNAGIVTWFEIVVSDTFGNTRATMDNATVTLLLQGENTTAHDVALQMLGPNDIGPGLTYLGDTDPSRVGHYRGNYTSTKAGVFQVQFTAYNNTLRGSGAQFAIGYGVFHSGVAHSFQNVNWQGASMQVECMAGVHTTFLFELRDEWGNTRITDDAIVNVDPDKRTSIPYDPPSWTVEYIGAGQYRVSLQMTSSGLFYVTCECANAALPTANRVFVQDSTLEFFAIAGPASGTFCSQTGLNPVIQAGIGGSFRINLKDRFGNDNSWDKNLTWAVSLQGPQAVQGSAAWQSLGDYYQVIYLPVKYGAYSLSVGIARPRTGVVEQIIGTPFSIQVRSANVDANMSTGSGLGLIRTDPGATVDSQGSTVYNPAGLSWSPVTLMARDAYRNPVSPDIVTSTGNVGTCGTSGAPACVPNRLSLEFLPDNSSQPLPCAAQTIQLPYQGNYSNHPTTFQVGIDLSGATIGRYILTYAVHYDNASAVVVNPGAVDDGLGGTWCNGAPVHFSNNFYRLAIQLDGNHIAGSPFRIRVGKYVPPDHKPYMVASDPADCGGACGMLYTQTRSGGRVVTTSTLSLDMLAGETQSLLFQNVFSFGRPNCQGTECDVLADDNTAAQYNDAADAPASFSMVVYRNGSYTDLGRAWPNRIIDGSDPRYGLYRVILQLNIVPFQLGRYAGGTYTVSILANGETINGCPFPVTIRPAAASAQQSTLAGTGLQAASVDVPANFSVQVRDAYGNRRPSGDNVIMQWVSTLGNSVVATGHTSAGSSTSCPVQSAPCYVVRYTVTTFTGAASFLVYVNGNATSHTPITAMCTPGSISGRTRVIARASLAHTQNVETAVGHLVAGTTADIVLQAHDAHGNTINSGGKSHNITVQIHARAAPSTSSTTVSNYNIDNGDGTYRISYTAEVAGAVDTSLGVGHQVHISVNDVGISGSPFWTTVVPADLFPATCAVSSHAFIASVPVSHAPAVDVSVAMKDQYGNIIHARPTGSFSCTLTGQGFSSDASNYLLMRVHSTVSGQHTLNVYYTAAGVQTPVGLHHNTYDYHVRLVPGEMVSANTAITNGVERTVDCTVGVDAVVTLHTKDGYANYCDRSRSVTNVPGFGAAVVGCSPLSDRTCGAVQNGVLLQHGSGVAANPNRLAIIIDKQDGTYEVTYKVVDTGYYQLAVTYGLSLTATTSQAEIASFAVALPSAILTRSPISFIVLADTPALAHLCYADGPGMQSIVAGQQATFRIVARGDSGDGSNTSVPRRGSGDIFSLAVAPGASLRSGGTVMTYQGSGEYSVAYTAMASGHVQSSWPVLMTVSLNATGQVILNSSQGQVAYTIGGPLASMPISVTMLPGPTAAAFMYVTGGGVTQAVAGETALFTITGKDAFNNSVTQCQAGEISSHVIVSGSYSSFAVAAGSVSESVREVSCSGAQYLMAYTVQLASPRWSLHVLFRGTPIGGSLGSIIGSPYHNVRVLSSSISAPHSFVSSNPTEMGVAITTGQWRVATAGASSVVFYHAVDRFSNRLTVPACTDGSTRCFAFRAQWCQLSRDVNLLSEAALDACAQTQGIPTTSQITLLANLSVSIYSVTFTLTASGTYAIAGSIQQPSGELILATHASVSCTANSGTWDYRDGSCLGTNRTTGVYRTGFSVNPAEASAQNSKANPPSVAVADEEVVFSIEVIDAFGNTVDNGQQTFTVNVSFLLGEMVVDDTTGLVTAWVSPRMPNASAISQHCSTCGFRWDASSNRFLATYKISTGGAATLAHLQVQLGGENIWSTPKRILVRAATNVAGLCYVLNNNTGPSSARALQLSRDLTNLDGKVVNEELIIHIQSMTVHGARQGYIACNPQQAAIIAEGGTVDCEPFDEFILSAVTMDTAQYSPPWQFKATGETVTIGGIQHDSRSYSGRYAIKWNTTVSGTYQLSISSFGVSIQNEAVQERRGAKEFCPGNCTKSPLYPDHLFTSFNPFVVRIGPGSMTSQTSSLAVSQSLQHNQAFTVTVIGRDKFENLVEPNAAQEKRLALWIKPLCDQAGAAFGGFLYDHSAAGTFRSTQGIPRFAGPTEVAVYYSDDQSCDTDVNVFCVFNATVESSDDASSWQSWDNMMVGGSARSVIVRVNMGRPFPNTGAISGGTVVRVPVYGVCNWQQYGFFPQFTCIYEDVASSTADVVSASTSSNEVEQLLVFRIASRTSMVGVTWELRQRQDYSRDIDNSTSVPINSGRNASALSHIRRMHTINAQGKFKKDTTTTFDGDVWASHAEIGNDQTKVRPPFHAGARYYGADNSCATAAWVAGVLRIMRVKCIFSTSYSATQFSAVESWGLCAGEYEIVIHNASFLDSDTSFTITDSAGTIYLRNVDKNVTDSSGVAQSRFPTARWVFALDKLHAIVCEGSPARDGSVGTVIQKVTALLHLEVAFPTVDPTHSAGTSNSNLTTYTSINADLNDDDPMRGFFYYYPAPIVSSVKPSDSAYASMTQHWGADNFRYVYVPPTGNSKISIFGTGFDTGVDADTNSFSCVFLDQKCVYSRTSSPMDCADNNVSNPARFDRTFLPNFDTISTAHSRYSNLPTSAAWWNSTRGKFVDDTRVDCQVPDFPGSGDYVLKLSVNLQDESLTDVWIRVFDVAQILPAVSATQGGTTVEVILTNADAMMNGTCKFGSFYRGDGSFGLAPVPAVRKNDTCLACIVPAVDAAITLFSADDEYQSLSNTMIDLTITFDGSSYGSKQNFFYYSQPDVSNVIPKLGPTSGGTRVRLELRAGEKYIFKNKQTGAAVIEAGDYSQGAAEFSPKCMFKTGHPNRGNYHIVDATFEFEQRRYESDFYQSDPYYREVRTGRCVDTTSWRYTSGADCTTCNGLVYSGTEWINRTWTPITPGVCTDNQNTYTSQQVVCIAPSNPTPGSAYFVDLSLDGIKWAYEDSNSMQAPKQFNYFADISIITMDATSNPQYNAQVEFRAAIDNGDATVPVRFGYSCGYSKSYEHGIRCQFGDIITKAQYQTLQFGADKVNKVNCKVPANANPQTTTIRLALNGFDFTQTTTQTVFTYYGKPIAMGAAYVTSVFLDDRQNQFTTAAALKTPIKTVVVELQDLANNYVSTSVQYGSRDVTLLLTRTFSGVTEQVYAANGTLGTCEYRLYDNWKECHAMSGFTSFSGIELYKPRAGGTYKFTISAVGVSPVCPEDHLANLRNSSYSFACLRPAQIELVIVIGPTQISNSIVICDHPAILSGACDASNDHSAKSRRPDLFINPGSGFTVRIQARDAADNNRIEGADNFRITSRLAVGKGTSAEALRYFNPTAVSNNIIDNEDGTYMATSFVIASSQINPINKQALRIWGSYEVRVEGLNGTHWEPIIGSPLRGYPETPSGALRTDLNTTLPRIDPVDCTMGGSLTQRPYGAEDCRFPGCVYSSPNAAGEACICKAGFQKSVDQSKAGGSQQHVVCSACDLGLYKVPNYEDMGNDLPCKQCPLTTHTLREGASSVSECICDEGYYDYFGADVNCIEEDWHETPPIQTNLECFPCPDCVDCLGNNSIVIKQNYWTDKEKPFVAYRCNNGPDGSCQGGRVDVLRLTMAAQSTASLKGAYGQLTNDQLCRTGGTGPTCANCALGFKKDQKTGCEICDEWLGLSGIDWSQMLLFLVFFAAAGWLAMRFMGKADPNDILKAKILISFGQVLQSFASTYNIEWPDGLKGFISKFDIINFDIFTIGSFECEFPGVKSFYTRFWGTMMTPAGLIGFIWISWKAKMKAVSLSRKMDFEKSMLEVKIEDIEITGGYISRAFFVLIFMYLKVSQTALDMFKCRKFRPSDEFLIAADYKTQYTDRTFLEADLTLPCRGHVYSTMWLFGVIAVFVYPVGVPGMFAFLLFRERDQIHDAINKKKYGFLFKDYAIAYFFWEIWDLMRKILLSGVLIFFNRGSVGQIIIGMLIALVALQIQLRIMPFDSKQANWIQILSFNCIFLTLFGALLLKVTFNKSVDGQLGQDFANVFLVIINASMPLMCIWLVVASIAYEFYLTTAGQKTKKLVLYGHRKTLHQAIKAAQRHKNGESASTWRGKLFHLFCKRDDIEAYLLSEELDTVRERREQRDQARVHHAEARVTVSEKREWLRFLKRNAGNEEEFRDLMENESIDTYKKMILGQAATDQDQQWGEFAGEQLNQAYKNPVFATRYKLANAILPTAQLEKQVRSEFKIIK